MRRLDHLGVTASVVLLGAAAFELALALGASGVGPEPGDAPAGEEAVYVLALVTLVVTAIATGRRAQPLMVIAAWAGAGFVLARFYTFDPYYAPTQRRYSDQGGVAPAWVWFVAVATILVAVAAQRRRRLAPVSSLALIACAATAVFEGAGH